MKFPAKSVTADIEMMHEPVINWLHYKSGACYEEHSHEETQITLFLSGEVEEWVGDQRNVIGPMDLVVKPGGLRHADQFGHAGAYTLQLSVNQRWLESIVAPTEKLVEYNVVVSQAICFRFLQCFSEAIEIREKGISRFGKNIAGFLNELARQRKKVVRTKPMWLEAISERVEAHFFEPLSVRELAREQHKHPVSVARAFREHFGVSIKQRIQQLRVKMAAGMLAENKLSTPAISQCCGFADQSHLSRVFKIHTGLTPGKYRQSLQCDG